MFARDPLPLNFSEYHSIEFNRFFIQIPVDSSTTNDGMSTVGCCCIHQDQAEGHYSVN